MRITIITVLSGVLLFSNANAKLINQASIIIHSYQLDREGLWALPAVSNTLIERKKTNASLTLNGDIKGFEYQLKHESQTEKTTLQKLFYIADINDNLSLQMGKFIENWQLGYAFGPLGLTDPYYPIEKDDDLNEKLGVNAIVIRYNLEDAYLDFYLGDDNKTRNNVHGYGYKSQAVRLNYILDDTTDISVVVHKKQDVKTGFGVGFRHIANDNSKFYGSFFTRKGTNIPTIRTPDLDPIRFINRTKDGKQYTRAMLGWHWTSDDNASIIAEISQDNRGLNNQEYDIMSDAHLALVRPAGIRQRYHFLRFGKITGDHEFSLSRRTSSDNSALNRLKWRYDINDNLQLNASYSTTTGSVNSEYKAYFPDQSNTDLVLRYNLYF